MVLFGKKKEKEGEKPKFRFDEIHEEFPRYEAETEFNESRIKEAVNDISFAPVMPQKMQSSMISSPLESDMRIRQGKTLFVKIDKYKDVMRVLDHVKSKLEDSERILGKLTELKNEEDRELDGWRNDLEDLKDKLLEIDKKLFEE